MERIDQGKYSGKPGMDLREWRIEAAAHELLIAAGRPEGWEIASEYEREAWRVVARRIVRAYNDDYSQ